MTQFCVDSSADSDQEQLRTYLSVLWFSSSDPEAGVHTSSVRSLRYGWWAYALGERTTPRLGPNSKIITVDGNLASGKGAVAQKLADKLGNYPPVLTFCSRSEANRTIPQGLFFFFFFMRRK